MSDNQSDEQVPQPETAEDETATPTGEAPVLPTFAEIGVQAEIATALERVGITHPFPIQAMTLPVALSGHDIIGQAKTGTGKTLGFGIPLLQRVFGPGEAGFDELTEPGSPQALVVVPTRELATQVAGDLEAAARLRKARILTIYGGRAYEPQIDTLNKGVEVVVGTPGRLIDLEKQGHLKLGHVRTVVLDEADEMLDLGFLPDVEKLLSRTPAGRQTMLFSATMPSAVVALARRYMTQPTHIRAADPDDTGATVRATTQYVFRAHALDKVEMIARILQAEGRGLTIIFSRTKRTADKVAEELKDRGFAAAAIHGDLGQGAREQALRAFRNGKVDVLVATDVAARGIDVEDVTHVINYQCPEDEKTYLHRIGRTGRAGNTGTAITFVDWDDLHRWTMIDKALDLGYPTPEETYSTSPHLYEQLSIPQGTKGTLPRTARTRAGLSAEVVEDLGETGQKGGARTGGRSGGPGSRDGSGGRDSGGGRSGGGGREGGGRDSSSRDSSSRDSSSREGSGDRESGAGGSSGPDHQRRRRRTRGAGPAAEGAASAGTDGSAAADAPAQDASTAASPDGGGTPAPRRRRRRRGGASASSSPAPTAE